METSLILIVILFVIFLGLLAWLIVLQIQVNDEAENDIEQSPIIIVPTDTLPQQQITQVNPEVVVNTTTGNDSTGNFELPFATIEAAITFLEVESISGNWAGDALISLEANGTPLSISSDTVWELNLSSRPNSTVVVCSNELIRTMAEVSAVANMYGRATDTKYTLSTAVVPAEVNLIEFENNFYACKFLSTTEIEVPFPILNLVNSSNVNLVIINAIVDIQAGSTLTLASLAGSLNFKRMKFNTVDDLVVGRSSLERGSVQLHQCAVPTGNLNMKSVAASFVDTVFGGSLGNMFFGSEAVFERCVLSYVFVLSGGKLSLLESLLEGRFMNQNKSLGNIVSGRNLTCVTATDCVQLNDSDTLHFSGQTQIIMTGVGSVVVIGGTSAQIDDLYVELVNAAVFVFDVGPNSELNIFKLNGVFLPNTPLVTVGSNSRASITEVTPTIAFESVTGQSQLAGVNVTLNFNTALTTVTVINSTLIYAEP